MPEQDNDIYRNYNFYLMMGGEKCAYFTEVSGLSADVETITYREGGGAPAVRKLPGRVSYGDVTLKWGLTRNRELTDWLKKVAEGIVEPREIQIVLSKPDGVKEATRWILLQAWPCSWGGAQLSSQDNSVAIETMVLTHEGLERGK
jgi:phage tail-like protein